MPEGRGDFLPASSPPRPTSSYPCRVSSSSPLCLPPCLRCLLPSPPVTPRGASAGSICPSPLLCWRDSGLRATVGVNSDGNMSLTWFLAPEIALASEARVRVAPGGAGRAQAGAEAPRGSARAGSGGWCLRPSRRTQCLG